MILNKEYPVYTEEGESVWFSFAVQETGEYRFASLGDTDTRHRCIIRMSGSFW